jgi:outer membrane protein OmpA-like peptidoglycan-associated protein
MNHRIAIAVAITLTLGASSLSVIPAAAQSKDELVRALTIKPRKLVVSPSQKLIVAPAPTQKMIVQPQGAPAQPQVQKMVVDPKPIVAQPQPVAPQPQHVNKAPTFSTQQLRQMATRRIVVEERQQIAAAVAQNGLPSVDMEVFFAYNSAVIDPSAFAGLYALGQALTDPRLYGHNMLIAGHTDASGSDYYNQSLSERRAWSVKSFLISNFPIDPQSLIAVGYGEEQLKDWYNPTSGINRRVQLVNLAAQ